MRGQIERLEDDKRYLRESQDRPDSENDIAIPESSEIKPILTRGELPSEKKRRLTEKYTLIAKLKKEKPNE